jgi:hypothetical protein
MQGKCRKGKYLGEFFLRFVVQHADSDSTTESSVVGVLCRHVAANTRYLIVGKFRDMERGEATHAQVSAHKLSRSVVLMPLLAPAASFC